LIQPRLTGLEMTGEKRRTLVQTDQSVPVRKPLALLLSVCLALFVADAVVSVADDSLILFFGSTVLSVVRGVVFCFAMLVAIIVYGLMALTPMIPKRWFLPLTLFTPVAALVLVPISIYYYKGVQEALLGISICQIILALTILSRLHTGSESRWALVSEDRLEPRGFSWRNLCLFLGVNVFVLLPAVCVYLAVCAALAVDHFSDGFMALRPRGLTVQVRKYGRDDGKTIELYPMSHIADSDFYQKVSESFPSNSIILMEGVTDNKRMLTNKISYKRMATSLGLAEQHEQFAPARGEMVRADVDVDQFATNTIGLLNLAMLVHTKGVNAETVLALIQYPQPPNFQEQLFDDLVRKRNEHLLGEIRARLPQSENIIVPWGALHMPGIAKEIQEFGFRLHETRDYTVIRFHFAGNEAANGKPN
jgi:hypothetical protein